MMEIGQFHGMQMMELVQFLGMQITEMLVRLASAGEDWRRAQVMRALRLMQSLS